MRIDSWVRGRALWRPLAVAAAIVAGFAIYGGVSRLTATPAGAAAPEAAVAPALVQSPTATTSYAPAVERAAPAVVTVRIEKKAEAAPSGFDDSNPFFQQFFGQNNPFRNQGPSIERGVGSGVIVAPNGRILTNNHVVDGANSVRVTLSDGREYTAKVVGTDAPSDLAVLQIDATDLPALPLGNSDAVRVGDVVLAIGDPLDVGETVTMGIISAKNRTNGAGRGNDYEDFLQTDAPINQGNSGGALITASGELIGINSQILTSGNFGSVAGNIGIGFAIPSNLAKNVMDQLVSGGHVRRALLGINVQSIDSDLANSLNLSAVRGAVVTSVEPNSAAAAAGVKQGDVVLKVNGATVEDANDLRNRIGTMAPGSTVTLDISRDGTPHQLSAKLGESTPGTEASADRPTGANNLGMTMESMSPSMARQLGVPAGTDGVVVTNVDPMGAAAQARIQSGDVILQIDGKAVHTPADVESALAAHRGNRPALVYLQHGDQRGYAALPAHN